MPKRGRKFITDFLVPNLDGETFGSRLAWVDRQFLIFQMRWNHKAAPAWTEDDFQVFVEWDKKRGHYRPDEKEYFTKSKQRFRAVLNKSIQDKEITQLQSYDKYVKLYFLGSEDRLPIGFDDVIDTIKGKKDTESHLMNPGLSLEQDDLTKSNVYNNALKDHNYQNVEDHSISGNNFIISYNGKQDITLNTLNDTEKNPFSLSFNDLLDTTNDEGLFLENLCSTLDHDREYSLQQGDDYSTLVLLPVKVEVPASLVEFNSSGISIKREIEHYENRSTKRRNVLSYLNKL